MHDYVVRVLAKEAGVRALACTTTGLVQEASRRHDASAIATATLGYGLTAGVLLGALLKVQQRVALKVEGSGPLRKMVVEADSYGRVRAYVSVPDVHSPYHIGPEDVVEAMGREGILTVVKDLRVKDLHQGVVALQGQSLDSELVHYLTRSEQIPSVVEIGVRLTPGGAIDAAGGILLQTMPGQDIDALAYLADRLEDLPTLDVMLVDGHSPEDIIAQVFGPIHYETLEKRSLEFRCSCSWERSRQALKILGQEDVDSLLAEGEAVVDCHFCHERYLFGPAELEAILAELEQEESWS